jgi:hypothetical protein
MSGGRQLSELNILIPADWDWGLGIRTGKFDESNGSKDPGLLSLVIKTD